MPFSSCRVRVPKTTDGATSLHKTLIVFKDSQCNGLMRRGATRLTSELESCGTPRGDSTYPSLSVDSVVAGDGGGSGSTFAKKLGANVASSRIMLALALPKESGASRKLPLERSVQAYVQMSNGPMRPRRHQVPPLQDRRYVDFALKMWSVFVTA